MVRLRHMMSGGAVPLIPNRFGGFARGTRVTVDGLQGSVLRFKGSDYTIKMDDGTRARAHVSKLQQVLESMDANS